MLTVLLPRSLFIWISHLVCILVMRQQRLCFAASRGHRVLGTESWKLLEQLAVRTHDSSCFRGRKGISGFTGLITHPTRAKSMFVEQIESWQKSVISIGLDVQFLGELKWRMEACEAVRRKKKGLTKTFRARVWNVLFWNARTATDYFSFGRADFASHAHKQA